MSAVFEADPEGFRAMQMGRPAAHLVRELVQNVFDEAASSCHVSVAHETGRGVIITVEDDVAGGIRDERLVFTLWASDKADSPTKRGRMGRGLKELVSVSDRTVVATQGRPAIEFVRERGDWKRRHTTQIEAPKVGTRVQARVAGWKAKDATAIVEYLRRVRPPENVRFDVNGEQVSRRPAIEAHRLLLPTVVYVVDEGERRVSNPHEYTQVELFAEEQTWVYEMGVPIEPVEYPLSIDVAQRVPLREQRDTMLSSYARELYAELLNARIDVMPREQLRDNHVLKAAEAHYFLSPEVKKKIAEAWTEGKPYAATPQQMSIATGAHISVINLRSLPEAIRDIVHGPAGVGTKVTDVLEARREELCPIVAAPTDAMRRLCGTWEWISRGIGRATTVVVREGQPGAIASFERGRNELAIYHQALPEGSTFFDWPLKGSRLSTLIHELSHWKALEESHGEGFYSDVDDVGGAVAQFLVEHADEALAMAQQGVAP